MSAERPHLGALSNPSIPCAGFFVLLTMLIFTFRSTLDFATGQTTATLSSKTIVVRDYPTLSEFDIHEAEQRLFDLGYWAGPIDGMLDESSRHALIAFQKVEGRPPTGRLNAPELQALRTATRPTPRETGYYHVEIDLTRQILFIVKNDRIQLIMPVATGTGKRFTEGGRTRRAITPTGHFTVYRKIDGWRKSTLGRLYFPNYIIGGVAIHGSHSVPTHPSSFGCICIPIYAAAEFSKLTPLGTVVVVYGNAPQPLK